MSFHLTLDLNIDDQKISTEWNYHQDDEEYSPPAKDFLARIHPELEQLEELLAMFTMAHREQINSLTFNYNHQLSDFELVKYNDQYCCASNLIEMLTDMKSTVFDWRFIFTGNNGLKTEVYFYDQQDLDELRFFERSKYFYAIYLYIREKLSQFEEMRRKLDIYLADVLNSHLQNREAAKSIFLQIRYGDNKLSNPTLIYNGGDYPVSLNDFAQRFTFILSIIFKFEITLGYKRLLYKQGDNVQAWFSEGAKDIVDDDYYRAVLRFLLLPRIFPTINQKELSDLIKRLREIRHYIHGSELDEKRIEEMITQLEKLKN